MLGRIRYRQFFFSCFILVSDRFGVDILLTGLQEMPSLKEVGTSTRMDWCSTYYSALCDSSADWIQIYLKLYFKPKMLVTPAALGLLSQHTRVDKSRRLSDSVFSMRALYDLSLPLLIWNTGTVYWLYMSLCYIWIPLKTVVIYFLIYLLKTVINPLCTRISKPKLLPRTSIDIHSTCPVAIFVLALISHPILIIVYMEWHAVA
jgi:hypothetical protein